MDRGSYAEADELDWWQVWLITQVPEGGKPYTHTHRQGRWRQQGKQEKQRLHHMFSITGILFHRWQQETLVW